MSRHSRSEGKKWSGRRSENNKIYAHPLPLVFSQTRVVLGLSSYTVLNPCCEGYWDAFTRSVWITNPKDSAILWQRGFFGKGNLSRSDPSWVSRQVNARKAALSGKGILIPLPSPEIETANPSDESCSNLGRDNSQAQGAKEAVQDGQSKCHCGGRSGSGRGLSHREDGYKSHHDPIGCHLEAFW